MSRTCHKTVGRKISSEIATKNVEATPERRWVIIGICGLLVASVWLVFGQTRHHEFVNLDDNGFIYNNEVIQRGVSVENVRWAFTHTVVSNWHPVTTLSHMLDCQLYGLNPGGHHLTNVFLHAITAAILFLILLRMTGATWASAFVALVFAIHPLRVESVAWVSERKDVLSGLFFALTVWAYIRYVHQPKSVARPLIVMVFFVLGLMCKPMLVTMPVVLLLLDYWPLKRFTLGTAGSFSIFRRLILEKTPLVILSIVASVITLMAQREAMPSTAMIPLGSRLANAVVSVRVYLEQLFWPAGLTPFYPLPEHGHTTQSVLVATGLLVMVSFGAWWWRKKHPVLLVGWLWFLAMLLPVIGLVQVGRQAHADRYTYLPQIGLYLALTWMTIQTSQKWKRQREILIAIASGIVLVLGVVAHKQTAYWRNSYTLWQHTLAHTSSNAIAESALAEYFLHHNRLDEAATHYSQALKIDPEYVVALNDLGLAFLQGGQLDKAIGSFEKAAQANTNDLDIASNLDATRILRQQAQATSISRDIVQPAFAAALNSRGLALARERRLDIAIECFRKASKVQPDQAEYFNNWGTALFANQELGAAVIPLTRALELNPASIEAASSLAWILATAPAASVRDGDRALKTAQRANEMTGGSDIRVLRSLAAAHSESGNFAEAIEIISRARSLAKNQDDAGWMNRLDSDHESYSKQRPLRDAPTTTNPSSRALR